MRTIVFVAAAACLLPMAGAVAQTAAKSETLSATEEQIREIKNPASWLSWGTDLRNRIEYLNNTLTLNPDNPLHEQAYLRFRARLWTSLKPIDDLSVNVRLATEPRVWFNPAGYTPFRGRTGTDASEGIFDNLNVKWQNIMGQPASLTVGRQDIFLGDGWLVGDGTPNDGSWTYYLDSARFTYELKEQHTTIDAIGIVQRAHDDDWIPTLNNQQRMMTDQNETGAIIDIGNKSIKEANVDAYFIYKQDEYLDDGDGPSGDNANIYTLGARLTGTFCDNWKYMVEGAYQFGEKQDTRIKYPAPSTDYRDLRAYGLQSRLTYQFKDKLNNQLSLNYEMLSGDDPNTQDDEAFDLLWGRWPHWSEIGLYSVAAEWRIGQSANLYRVGPTWVINPMKGMEFNASYFALFADQEVATRGGTGLFSNSDNFRGHFVQAVLKHKFSSHLSGHLWGELLFPGDYYTTSSMMSFLRAELTLTF